METRDQYAIIAQVFKYPDSLSYAENVNRCYEMLREKYPELAEMFLPFLNFVNSNDPYRIEEVFNLTFHIQAICYLDLGYVLFGEDYKRGEFLVNMKNEQEKIGHDCGYELPDNLPMVLELLALSKDDVFINELAVRILIPALEKMTKEFSMARIALRQKIYKKKEKVLLDKDEAMGNVYGSPINVLYQMLQRDFAGISYKNDEFEPEYGRNFLVNCGTCGEHDPVVAKKPIDN